MLAKGLLSWRERHFKVTRSLFSLYFSVKLW